MNESGGKKIEIRLTLEQLQIIQTALLVGHGGKSFYRLVELIDETIELNKEYFEEE